MTSLCVYFGTEPPDVELSASTTGDLDVVLEPYHPLVKTGGFTEAFPHARRFVYVNPTTVDPWVLRQLADPPPLIGWDERWNLPRLDLEHPDGFAWAVRSACAALAGDEGRLHGAFVDDLDRMVPAQEELAVEYFSQVTHQLGWEPAWFVNRGFSLWQRIEHLEAVLLEDISPSVSSREPVGTVRWLREEVLPSVRSARDRGVRVHSLSYADQEEHLDPDVAADQRLHDQITAVVDSITTGADRNLHEWRTSE